MKESWKILSPRELFIVLLAFAFLASSIYRAVQFEGAAPRERTTSTHDLRIDFQLQINLLLPNYYRYSCYYNFAVGGVSYSSRERCPKLIDDSIKAQSHGYFGSLPVPNRVVYYDSADPSINSLTEFGAISDRNYRIAAVIAGVGVVVVSFVAWAMAITSNGKRKNRGIFVDTHETVIYPDQIDSSLGSDGLFNKDRRADGIHAAGDGAPAYVPDSDPSHALRELYLEVVKQIHPDRASDERDEALRERLMKEANAAFKREEVETLRRILIEYKTVTSTS